jgi:hypothetical protein
VGLIPLFTWILLHVQSERVGVEIIPQSGNFLILIEHQIENPENENENENETLASQRKRRKLLTMDNMPMSW